MGFELKESYHAQAVRNCERVQMKATQVEKEQRSIFDALEEMDADGEAQVLELGEVAA